MDFENQFTRPMIHALGTRLAILKMESVCDRADAKFQQGFELGFEEAFDFMREFSHADAVIERLDLKEKIKKAAENAKETGIPQVTAVQGKGIIEPTPATDEKIHDIPSFAGPLSEGEKIEQNLQEMMDDAGVPDLRTPTTVENHTIRKDKTADGTQYFKFIAYWIVQHKHVPLESISTEYVLRETFDDVLDFTYIMVDAYKLFGNKKCYEIKDFKNIVTVYDLGVYLADHCERME